ncbi:hypothetical protein TNCV_688511 [Trichonephila clavipes]|nr:hypothetical protein TNCV_688511 [Trichonephila clavipes]
MIFPGGIGVEDDTQDFQTLHFGIGLSHILSNGGVFSLALKCPHAAVHHGALELIRTLVMETNPYWSSRLISRYFVPLQCSGIGVESRLQTPLPIGLPVEDPIFPDGNSTPLLGFLCESVQNKTTPTHKL